MKKLLILSIILILCFGGCSAAEDAGEYSFSLSLFLIIIRRREPFFVLIPNFLKTR